MYRDGREDMGTKNKGGRLKKVEKNKKKRERKEHTDFWRQRKRKKKGGNYYCIVSVSLSWKRDSEEL